MIVERDIVKQLLEARIHHNRALPEGWLVTAEYCLELAKARYDQGRDTVFSHAAHSQVQLTLQDKEILHRTQPQRQAAKPPRASGSGKKTSGSGKKK